MTGRQARRFLLIRHSDISGVGGTGVVAEGIRFSDDTVALRWYGAAPATAVWNSIDAVLAVHGHRSAKASALVCEGEQRIRPDAVGAEGGQLGDTDDTVEQRPDQLT